MDLGADAIAGVVDLFGGLTREELGQALAELAFKRGEEYDPAVFGEEIDAALDSYHLVAVDVDRVEVESPLLTPGPVAFPELPEGATDLPHILDVPERTVDRATVAAAAERQFAAEATAVAEAGDEARAASLVDVSYELEAWGSIDLSAARERLDEVGE